MNLHALLPRSRVNGPGLRAVVWFQGCFRRCPGCFNPDTHDFAPRILLTPQGLWQWVQSVSDIEGITLTGGEPLLQAGPLAAFLRLVRAGSGLSVVLYTGYTLSEARSLPYVLDVLSAVDVIIAGPFECDRLARDGIRGSNNQEIHLLTDRYSPQDLAARRRCEFFITPAGSIVHTGVNVMPLPPGIVPEPLDPSA